MAPRRAHDACKGHPRTPSLFGLFVLRLVALGFARRGRGLLAVAEADVEGAALDVVDEAVVAGAQVVAVDAVAAGG